MDEAQAAMTHAAQRVDIRDTYTRVVGQGSAQTTFMRQMFGFAAIVEKESYVDAKSEDAAEYGVRGFG